jgi:hypothetical protein
MTKQSHGNKVMVGLAAGVLASALSFSSARADEGMSKGMSQRTSPTTAERTKSQTFVVSGIDRSKRNVTLTNAEGERNTMNVPSEIKSFDTLKVGDRVDVDYKESIAVQLAPSDAKPSMSEKTIGSRMSGGGAGAVGREMQVVAQVVSVDPDNNKVVFRGPKGNLRTVTVEDPGLQQKLPNLKPGMNVQFTYTEAVAASIRPAPAK